MAFISCRVVLIVNLAGSGEGKQGQILADIYARRLSRSDDKLVTVASRSLWLQFKQRTESALGWMCHDGFSHTNMSSNPNNHALKPTPHSPLHTTPSLPELINSWWKRVCWLKALYHILSFRQDLSTTVVYRRESGRCCAFLFFLTFLSFSPIYPFILLLNLSRLCLLCISNSLLSYGVTINKFYLRHKYDKKKHFMCN